MMTLGEFATAWDSWKGDELVSNTQVEGMIECIENTADFVECLFNKRSADILRTVASDMRKTLNDSALLQVPINDNAE